MAAGSLTSDHVNYLIWRYLQESGHPEAAVKLQRNWLQDPQTLPFANRIKTHALVALVQKGLQYYQVEQSLDQPENRNCSSAATLFFGAESGRASSSTNQDQFDDAAQISRGPRKHVLDSTANGLGLDFAPPTPAPKRRRNNGTEGPINGDRQTADSMQMDKNGYHFQQEPPEPVSPPNYSPTEDGANGMDLDEDADAAGSPTPEDPIIQTLTNGQSRAVQSDKIAELGPQTSMLTVPENTHVMHTAWNPKDPTILAVAGEALCRLWSITRTASFADNPSHKPYVDILDPAYPSLVTSMAWNPAGDVLAVATRDDSSDYVGAVSLWSKAGKNIDELPAAQDTVLTLRWSPSGTQLLGITASGTGSSALILWDMSSSQAMPPYALANTVRDATWISNNQLIICGHDIIASSLLEAGRILTLNSRSEPLGQQNWSHICYDSRTHTTALAAEDTAVLGLIDSSDVLRTTKAHDMDITALAYQPITNSSAYPADAPRLLTTSSLDGSIRIWDAKRPFTLVHNLPLGYAVPAMAMSFTPDGYLVAGANCNRALIWNAEAGGLPKMSWKGVVGKIPNGTHTNGDAMDTNMQDDDMEGERNCCLSWDSEGGKLALGVGNQVAIINLRP